jgi:hypothetical protein
MAYPPKIQLALDALAKTGIGPWTYAPPLYRLFWHLGLPIRPPHFSTFTGNFLLMTSWFGVFFTAVMWFVLRADRSVTFILFQCGVTAVLFGLIMAAWTRFRVRKLNLPAWSELDVVNRFD